MGNQHSVGWVSTAALDHEEVISIWVSAWKEMFKSFTDEQLRLVNETREEHFTKDIKRHLRDAINKRFLLYKTEKVTGFVIVQDREDYVQVYGIALKPYTLYNLRTVAIALFNRLQEDYPDKEFRGMVKAVNERGKLLYRYLGAVECDDWHDSDYDEHHTPLRITSTAAKLAATKNSTTELPTF